MITSQNKEIQALVNDIRDGRLLLPELQRQFVWKSTQVRDLFDSLYHQYPSGQILVWETDDLPYAHQLYLTGVANDEKHPHLLLDGQQRLTSLSAILLHRELLVRDSKRPIDIVFNIYTEKFEVSGPRQSPDAGWISLTKLFTNGILSIIQDLKLDIQNPQSEIIFSRLTQLDNIKTYKFQVNILQDLNYDEVTHIFVRINSGGTKLGSSDLALAQLSSRWRGITEEIEKYRQEVWKQGHGLWLSTGIIIRAFSALVAGQTRLSQLFKGERQNITVEQLQEGWERFKSCMDQSISFILGNCTVNRMDLLPTHYIFIPLCVFFDRFKTISPKLIRDLERWTLLALIWSRYSVSAESNADQDINAIRSDDPIKNLIQNIEDKVGKQRLVTERELRDQRKNSPYMLMAYILARRNQAHDWFNGVLIDGTKTLEFHHIFPKDVLREKYDLKVDSLTIDQIANLVFLSKKANLKILSQAPTDYLAKLPPEYLRDQYVTLNSELWDLEKFEDFLLERRTQLANAINLFLNSLEDGKTLWVVGNLEIMESRVDIIENKLRKLIFDRLFTSRAENAWELIPQEIQNNIEIRIQKQILENPFLKERYKTFEEKLDFCQFSDYQKIIRVNWLLFKEDFGKSNIFEHHFQEVIDVRNSLKHNRDIPDNKLASAEAGLLWLEDCLGAAVINESETHENGNDDKPEDHVLEDEV